MLDFSRWKIAIIAGVCLFFALLAMPNLFSESTREQFSAFLPSRTVNLGLDLQGGSYLLLELQFDHYIHEQLNSVVDSLRAEMIAKNIMYQGLGIAGNAVKFALVKPDSTIDIKSLVKKNRARYGSL